MKHRPLLPAPTRFFNVGDKVRFGGFRNIHVVEVVDGGLGYLLHYDFVDKGRQLHDQHKVGHACTNWMDVFTEDNGDSAFAQEDDIQIRFMNNEIDSLLHKVYHTGVDFDPPYQRGLVWNDDQKTALLDSIFQNIEIGKFTFNRCEFGTKPTNKLYEIIDGKQRLTAICEFYEGRFRYRGKLYHELSWSDMRHFNGYPIVQAEMQDATEQQILRLFVKLNTTGVPMDAKHLDRVKEMIR